MPLCDSCERFTAPPESPVCGRCAVRLARSGTRLPNRSTQAPPGSPGKLAVLELRARLKLALWHPGDASDDRAKPRAMNVDPSVRGVMRNKRRFVGRIRFGGGRRKGQKRAPIHEYRVGSFATYLEAAEAVRRWRASAEGQRAAQRAKREAAPPQRTD